MTVTNDTIEPAWEPKGLAALGRLDHPAIFSISITESRDFMDTAMGILSQGERDFVGRLRKLDDRLRFALGRSALRKLLGMYTKLEATEVPFIYSDYGKPFLSPNVTSNLHFNVSHSADQVLIALHNCPIGVDTELIVPDFYEDLITDIFSAEEEDLVRQANHPQQLFYLLWTRKEAQLKKQGQGLGASVKDIPALDGQHKATLNLPQPYETLSFYYAQHYVGSVCLEQLHPAIGFYSLSLRE